MKAVLASLCLLTWATSASGQAITSHSGALTHGSSVTLTVTGAGTKTQNTQLLWDPMNGTHGNTNIEGRTPAGTRRWLISTGTSPEPSLSNAVVRNTPGRTTSVFMQQSGGTPPPTIAVGGGTTKYLGLTAASLPNRQALGNGPLFFSAWINYTKDPTTNNIKTVRYWDEDGVDAPGIFWFANPSNPNDDAAGHNRFFDVKMGQFGNGAWHQTKHLFHWSTRTYIRVYFDNRLVVDTNPAGQYNAPGGGFTEGPWGNLPEGDQIDSYAWESQGNATGGGSRERYYLADAFVDSGYNRVELCNAATYRRSNHCEMQPYTAWPVNNGSLTITLNRGTFAGGAAAYLYLCNATDVCSAGYAVTLGGPVAFYAPRFRNLADVLFLGVAGIALLVRRSSWNRRGASWVRPS
jgi:hypothetical protein